MPTDYEPTRACWHQRSGVTADRRGASRMVHLAVAGGEPVRRTPFPRWPFWGQEEIHAVQAVVESGRWGAQQGTEVHRFEAEFAAYQGAAWQGRRAGTLGHAAGFSFQSSKNITAGEGGM